MVLYHSATQRSTVLSTKLLEVVDSPLRLAVEPPVAGDPLKRAEPQVAGAPKPRLGHEPQRRPRKSGEVYLNLAVADGKHFPRFQLSHPGLARMLVKTKTFIWYIPQKVACFENSPELPAGRKL